MIGIEGFYGDKLKEARESRGLTSIQLSELIGVSKQMISLYELSKSCPAQETFQLIAEET